MHFLVSGFLGRQEISSQFDRICGWFDQDYGTAAQYTVSADISAQSRRSVYPDKQIWPTDCAIVKNARYDRL